MKTTPGPWMVGVSTIKDSPDKRKHFCVGAQQPDGSMLLVAVTGLTDGKDRTTSTANAALMASAPEMLEALIAIQESAMNNSLDAEGVKTLISDVFAKIANESGEKPLTD